MTKKLIHIKQTGVSVCLSVCLFVSILPFELDVLDVFPS